MTKRQFTVMEIIGIATAVFIIRDPSSVWFLKTLASIMLFLDVFDEVIRDIWESIKDQFDTRK